jgi:hypothetical protein
VRPMVDKMKRILCHIMCGSRVWLKLGKKTTRKAAIYVAFDGIDCMFYISVY